MDLAAAIETIREIGDDARLMAAVEDAFPGSSLNVENNSGWFSLRMKQSRLLRPLSAAELSDGTLRYLLFVAALLTPRPPALMVLNEPETSLHPDLIAPLARLIAQTSERSQIHHCHSFSASDCRAGQEWMQFHYAGKTIWGNHSGWRR
jgi:predicted ATPase